MNTKFRNISLITFLCSLLVVGCGKKTEQTDVEQATTTSAEVKKPYQNFTEEKLEKIKGICAQKAKPLCTFTANDGIEGDACVEQLWMGYCINVFVDMGLGGFKVDLSKNNDLKEGYLKYGLIDKVGAEAAEFAINNSNNICRNQASTQYNFDAYTSRMKKILEAIKLVNAERQDCQNELVLQEK